MVWLILVTDPQQILVFATGGVGGRWQRLEKQGMTNSIYLILIFIMIQDEEQV